MNKSLLSRRGIEKGNRQTADLQLHLYVVRQKSHLGTNAGLTPWLLTHSRILERSERPSKGDVRVTRLDEGDGIRRWPKLRFVRKCPTLG